jgi:hypothetical protein
MNLISSENNCPICNRDLGIHFDEHHLTPKEEGGTFGPTVFIHKICHQKIHSLFTNKQLANTYNSVEALLSHPDMIKFVRWVSKKDPNYYDKSVSSNVKSWR